MRLLAWAGGAVFVASLAYLIYFYVVILGSPIGDVARISRNTAIDVALFSGFALHHSLLARSGAKARLARVFRPAFERSFYVWTASLLLIAVCVLWQPLPGVVYDVDGLWRVPFWLVQALGAVLTVRGATVIDPLELAGIRQVIGDVPRDTLKIVGPFRHVRHPIYLGWMLMVFLTPTMTVNRLVFAMVSSVYLLLAIQWEERSLIAAHGASYRQYQHAVRWRVLPGIW